LVIHLDGARWLLCFAQFAHFFTGTTGPVPCGRLVRGFSIFVAVAGSFVGSKARSGVSGKTLRRRSLISTRLGLPLCELDGEQALQRAFVRVVVDQLGGGLAVDEVLSGGSPARG